MVSCICELYTMMATRLRDASDKCVEGTNNCDEGNHFVHNLGPFDYFTFASSHLTTHDSNDINE